MTSQKIEQQGGETEKLYELEDRICQLWSSARLFNDKTRELSSLFPHAKSKNGKSIITIHSALYFSYVINALATLLSESGFSGKEQSFTSWWKLKNTIVSSSRDVFKGKLDDDITSMGKDLKGVFS